MTKKPKKRRKRADISAKLPAFWLVPPDLERNLPTEHSDLTTLSAAKNSSTKLRRSSTGRSDWSGNALSST